MVKADEELDIKKILEEIDDLSNPDIEKHLPLIVTAMCKDIEWLKDIYGKINKKISDLDGRMYHILTGVILVILIEIVMILLQYYNIL